MRTQVLRRSIHEREGGECFYRLRRTIRQTSCLDHVALVARLQDLVARRPFRAGIFHYNP